MERYIVDFHLVPGAEHQEKTAKLLQEAIEKDGGTCRFVARNQCSDGDIHAIWSWKQNGLIDFCRDNMKPLLVMERGYIDRMNFTSLCFNGLNGKGEVNHDVLFEARFDDNFGDCVYPWRENEEGYALLIGQVPDDPSLEGVDHYKWLNGVSQQLQDLGYAVLYRPHPWVRERIERGILPEFCPEGAILSDNEHLYDDFHEAAFCVTFSSNTAVDAVLQGIPTVTFSEMSIAYEVTSHDLNNPIYTPDRKDWLNKLAHRQWTDGELKDGTAWGYVKKTLKLFSQE